MKIFVIFETSWLMLVPGKPWSFFNYSHYEFTNREFDRVELPAPLYPDVELILPTEVKEELAKHIADKDKEQAAQQGRNFCASLMKLPEYRERSLADLTPPEMSEKVLGPDSDVKKRIIALALRCAEEGIVYVATHDGGIKAELTLLFAKKHLPIYSATTKKEFSEALEKADKAGIDKMYKENKKCFIATACFGSADCAEVLVLRTYRDRVLRSSCFGQWFIAIYYRCSPIVAQWLTRHPLPRRIARKLVVDPAVWVAKRRIVD